MEKQYIVLCIFILTYIFISVQRIPVFRIDRPSGVCIGSTLLMIVGFLDIREAYAFINWDVITFLLGMMVMVAYLEYSGFFEHTALWLIRHSSSSRQLLMSTLLSSASLSALFVNDTICLLFTPILLKAAVYLKLNPIPFLIAIATGSNIGSALTITGNPQNMYIGIQSGISFMRFMTPMIIPVMMGLAINYAVLCVLFRKDIDSEPLSSVSVEIAPLRKVLMLKTLAALAVTLALFFTGIGYPLAALIGMMMIFMTGFVPPRFVLKEVNWTILLFFAGLFVVMGAFEKSGYMRAVTEISARYFSENTLSSRMGLSLVTVILSNLVSNVPAVILMQPLAIKLGSSEQLWLMLAMASTFAGNLTLIGSVANLIVAEKAREQSVRLSFWEYMRVGFPLTLITIVFAALWLHII